MSLPSYKIQFFSGEAMLRDFMSDIAARLARLEANGQMPVAVAVRDDLFPGMTDALGYPLVRLERSSPVMWGVIA